MSNKIKRFYAQVTVVPDDGGYVVQLDDRSVKSPRQQLLVLPDEQLALDLALEWRSQGELIDPATMPLMRFAGIVADNIIPHPKEARTEIAKYARSDLLCYRASEPDTLVERQNRLWDPILAQFSQDENVAFVTNIGIQYVEQDAKDMRRFAELIERIKGFELGALHTVTILTGSAALGVALYKGWLQPDAVWKLCHLDEDFQIEQWGADEDEIIRRQQRHQEFGAAVRFLRL